MINSYHYTLIRTEFHMKNINDQFAYCGQVQQCGRDYVCVAVDECT
jgi:hypothetical protein